MLGPSFPRRQQYRRWRRAATSGAAGLAVGTLAVIAAGAGSWAVAGALLLVAVGLLVDVRRWMRLAARSRVGGLGAGGTACSGCSGDGGMAAASAAAISTALRSRRRASRARSRSRPKSSARTTSPERETRPLGSGATAGAGVPGGRSRSCALSVPEDLSVSRKASWSCRSIGCFPRSEPALALHRSQVFSPARPRAADRRPRSATRSHPAAFDGLSGARPRGRVADEPSSRRSSASRSS
jgi:hypothetical protein